MAEREPEEFGRVREPRRKGLTFPALSSTGTVSAQELPFVLGILGDFSGTAAARRPALGERSFRPIERDNFNEVLATISPELHLLVENLLAGDGSELEIRLRFRSLDDFAPARIVEQIELLRKIWEARGTLRAEPPDAPAPRPAPVSLLDDILETTAANNPALAGAPQGARKLNQPANKLDLLLSRQLAAIFQHPDFRRLEGSWRGLKFLVDNAETGPHLKFKLLDASKRELFADLVETEDVEESELLNMLEDPSDAAESEPFAALIGDYEFAHDPDDVALLGRISQVAAAAFCPFVAAASAEFFGLESYARFPTVKSLDQVFTSPAWLKWKAFREAEESRFVVLTLPRVLSRLPYGQATQPAEGFDFEEVEPDARRRSGAVPHEHYAWMSAAFVLGACLADTFGKTGWCTAIAGAENGTILNGLPVSRFSSDDGSVLNCATEVAIISRRGAELSAQGLLPLCYDERNRHSAFAGTQTAHKPKKFDVQAASQSAAVSARLPFVLATSRIAHYLRAIASAQSAEQGRLDKADLEAHLNRWIAQSEITNSDPASAQSGMIPLAAARIAVKDIPGFPGAFDILADLQPWLVGEQLSKPVRIVVRVA